MALARNTEEVFALERFQKLVDDLSLDQGTLMRFLRARNLDLTDAEDMIRNYYEWSNKNIYKDALTGWKPPKELVCKFQVYHCGPDAEGRPVFYIHFGKWMPTRQIYNAFESFEVVLFAYKTFLSLYEEIEKSQHQQVVAILDNEGMGFQMIFKEIQNWTGVQTLIDIWKLYEANFPETLHKAFFINTCRSFMWGFSMLKPFVAKQTLSKISFFGAEEDKWKHALHESLPISSIPEQYGGKSKMRHVYDIVYDGIATKYIKTNNTTNS